MVKFSALVDKLRNQEKVYYLCVLYLALMAALIISILALVSFHDLVWTWDIALNGFVYCGWVNSCKFHLSIDRQKIHHSLSVSTLSLG